MEGVIILLVFFVIPIITFVTFYFEYFFRKNKKLNKSKLILINVALLIYMIGMLTPISNIVTIIIVYIIFLCVKILKKDCKKCVLKILILTVIVTHGLDTSNVLMYAFETKESEYEKAVRILKNEYAMDDFLVSKLGEKEVIELAKQAKENPNCLEVRKSTNVIDNIESIENAVNLDEKQLIENCGLDEDTAKQVKLNIEKQRDLSDDELKEKYRLSDAEVKIFKKALDEQEDYVPHKNNKREVTLSSTISSSYLDFYDIILNQCSGDTVQYNITVSFNWLKPCFNGDFDDAIAVSWGGDLSYKSGTVSKQVDYSLFWGIYPAWKFYGNLVGSKSPTAEITIDKGVKYSFPQQYNNNMVETRIKEGLIQFKIGSNTKKNRTTQIVSRYCHRVISFSSASISISGPGIEASSAYECTDEDENCTDIRY